MRHEGRVPGAAAVVAIALGLGHAAVSLYWLVGGTALLSTLGEQLESWGRDRTAGALLLLAGVTIVKLGVACLPTLIVGPLARSNCDRRSVRNRLVRATGWLSAGALVAYGGVMTTAGVLVDLGVFAVDVDQRRALRWHAYFWDPWFLLWGSALLVVMITTRARDTDDRVGRPL